MVRSRRILGRLEAGVSLKAFEERKWGREERGGERERERDLVTKPLEDSFVGNSSGRRQRTSRRIALPLDIARIRVLPTLSLTHRMNIWKYGTFL